MLLPFRCSIVLFTGPTQDLGSPGKHCVSQGMQGNHLTNLQGLQDPRGAHAVRAAGCCGRGRPPAQAAAGAAGDRATGSSGGAGPRQVRLPAASASVAVLATGWEGTSHFEVYLPCSEQRLYISWPALHNYDHAGKVRTPAALKGLKLGQIRMPAAPAMLPEAARRGPIWSTPAYLSTSKRGICWPASCDGDVVAGFVSKQLVPCFLKVCLPQQCDHQSALHRASAVAHSP